MAYWWVITPNRNKMPGRRGPYVSESRADSISDSDDKEDSVVIETDHDKDPEAAREIKEALIERYGYAKGSKRLSRSST